MDTQPAPPLAEPGFYLIDDAQGRFVIDREFGHVSLAEESLLAREAGALHVARLRVVQPSGTHYELSLRLRITGRIPQMAGGEENDFLLNLAGTPIPEAAPAAPQRATAWTLLTAACCEAAPWGMAPISRAAVDAPMGDAQLDLGAPPPAAARANAVWNP